MDKNERNKEGQGLVAYLDYWGTKNGNLETSKELELSISFQTDALEKNQEEASGGLESSIGGLIPNELKSLEVKSKEIEAFKGKKIISFIQEIRFWVVGVKSKLKFRLYWKSKFCF